MVKYPHFKLMVLLMIFLSGCQSTPGYKSQNIVSDIGKLDHPEEIRLSRNNPTPLLKSEVLPKHDYKEFNSLNSLPYFASRPRAISPDNQTIALLNTRDGIQIRSIKYGKILYENDDYSDFRYFNSIGGYLSLDKLIFSPDGKLLVAFSPISTRKNGSPGVDKEIIIMTPTLKILHKIRASVDRFAHRYDVFFTNQPDKLLLMTMDGLKLINIKTGEIKTGNVKYDVYASAAISPDGKIIATVDHKTLQLRSTSTLALISQIELNSLPESKEAFRSKGSSRGIQFGEDSRQLAILSHVGIHFIQLDNHGLRKQVKFASKEKRGNIIKRSPDGRFLLVGFSRLVYDTTVFESVYSFETGKMVTRLNKMPAAFIVVISNDGRSLIGSHTYRANDDKSSYRFFTYTLFGSAQHKAPLKLVSSKAEKKYRKWFSKRIPAVIPKPKLPKAPTLKKSQFETMATFEQRVQKMMQERAKLIENIQSKYRTKVEARNKIIRDWDENKAQSRAESDAVRSHFLNESFRAVMGLPEISNPSFDAEKQLLYVDYSLEGDAQKMRVALSVPISQAAKLSQAVASQSSDLNVESTHRISGEFIRLDKVKVSFKDQLFEGKLSDSSFVPEKIEVALKDKKMDLKVGLAKLQNPNLVDTFRVTALASISGQNMSGSSQYSEDDIPALLSKSKSVTESNKRWLVVIGIETYDNTDDIIFSYRSAEMFAKVAQKTLGIRERNSYIMLNDKATGSAIKGQLKLMLKNVKEGDTIYFYYSGHGIPALPEKEPYILAKDVIPDYVTDDKFFKLQNIYKMFSSSKAKKVVAFVDSCFSGATDGISVIKGVAASRLKPKSVTFDKEKMVVLTAGRDTQYSNMYKDKGHRLFSYFVMKSLLSGRKDIDSLYKEVFLNVKDESFEMGDLKIQEPSIEGNRKLSLF